MRRASFILAVAFFVLGWLTNPVNRTEAEDAYLYAWDVERAPVSGLIHEHHLMAGSFARALYTGAQWAGYRGRAHDVMVLFSLACAAVALGFFHVLLRRRAGLAPAPAIWATLGLALSCGFWRYAVEAELYAPAAAALMVALYASLGVTRWRDAVGPSFLWCLAIGMHVLNLVPLAAVLGMAILKHRPRGPRLAVAAVGLALIAACYPLAMKTTAFRPSAVAPPHPLELAGSLPSRLAAAAAGAGSSVVSGQFLFGFPSVADGLRRAFPSRQLDEEIWLGRRIGPARAGLIAGLVILLAGTGAWMFARRCRIGRAGPVAVESLLPAAAGPVWLALYAAVILAREPGNPEMWILGLPALWLTVGRWMAPLFAVRRAAVHAFVFATLLGLTNLAGGLLPLADPAGDFNRARGGAAIRTAKAGDVVLTAGGPVLARYLRYMTPASVEELHEWNPDTLREHYDALGLAADNVYALPDVWAPPASLAVRFPASARAVQDFADGIRPDFKPVPGAETSLLVRKP